MRILLGSLASLSLAAALAGCDSPCQELGNRLCECRGSGTSRQTCEQAVSDELDRLSPGKDVQDLCKAYLESCHAPDGVDFCTWIEGEDGKQACGFALPPETP